VRLYDLVAKGDLNAAAALWKTILPAQIFYWTHDYNSSVKAATNLLGGNVGICRKPALPLSEADLAELKTALSPLGRTTASAAQSPPARLDWAATRLRTSSACWPRWRATPAS
jgi:4-hydroxy-tetrahydrodipicolinate synthase